MVVAFSFMSYNSAKVVKLEYAAGICWYKSSQSEGAVATGYGVGGAICMSSCITALGKIGSASASTMTPLGWGVAAAAFGL